MLELCAEADLLPCIFLRRMLESELWLCNKKVWQIAPCLLKHFSLSCLACRAFTHCCKPEFLHFRIHVHAYLTSCTSPALLSLPDLDICV